MASSSTYPHSDQSPSLVARHKRRGVALSCAECRRLKLKCSRVFPCSNCVKKGCSAICPDGSLTTGKGNRFVLANTEALHDKINELANRVRHLEDALAQSHALNSVQPHPLLSDELLQIKRPLERERLDNPPQKEEKIESNEDIDALGSLSLSQGGRSTFFGQTANSWYLLQNEEGSEEDDEAQAQESILSPDVPWLSYAFPLTTTSTQAAENLRTTVVGLLPRASLAKKICNTYYRHAAWMYTPISEADFFETIFRPVYDSDAAYLESVGSHKLAVLYMALALGVLMDLERPPHSAEAAQYYQLGRTALSLESVLEEQSIPAVQALLMMCHYMFLSDMGGPRWVIMGIVVKLAHSIGLHRDSGKWKLEPEETQKRRELFYELLTYDSWQSLTFGRPPSLSTAHFDTSFPHPTTRNTTGEIEMSFAAWKHRFSAECLSVVHDQAFGAKTPNYKTIQELDRKVRTYYIPPSLQVPGFGRSNADTSVEQPSVEITMQRYIAFAIREITLFYMHRGFFAHALEGSPNDPMGSKYGPSVLAAYTSACSFVGLIESLFKQHPAMTERMWFLFTHVFSCAIVLGSIATKPQMALAPSALSHLESAFHLFARVSDNSRAGKILPILEKLKERAQTALSGSETTSNTATRVPFFSPPIKREVDELSALGGMTRLVSRRTSSVPSTPSHAGSSPGSQPTSPHLQTAETSPYKTMHETPVSWQGYPPVQDFGIYPVYPIQQSHNMSLYGASQQQAIGGLDILPEYYSYPSNGTVYMPLQQPEVTPPPHDLNDSWQNFMAQFRQ